MDTFVPFALIWMAVCSGILLYIVAVVIRGTDKSIDLLEEWVLKLDIRISNLEEKSSDPVE